MSTHLVSERDALRKAVELAEQKASEAQLALKHAETKIAVLVARIRSQKTKLETMYHRVEKQSSRHHHHIEKAHRISVLETQYQECLLENRTLRTRLLDTASKRSAAVRGPVRWHAHGARPS